MYTILKKIQETQFNARLVLCILLFFEILFIVFQTSANIFEIYDFGVDERSERQQRWQENFAIGKIIFTLLQMPTSAFIIYLYFKFHNMGHRLHK